MEKLSGQKDSGATTPVVSAPPSERGGAIRATLSFLVFGTLGAIAGRFLGGYGDNAHHQLAKPFWTFFGGLFSGILAAYTSVRVSEREAMEYKIEKEKPQSEKIEPVPLPEKLPHEPNPRTPNAMIDATSVEHKGEAKPSHLHEMEIA